MENAALIGLSRQVGLQRQLDVVANNLANINTSGFKGQKLLFEQYLMPVASHNDFERTDKTLSFAHDWGTLNDLGAGSIRQTDNPLDVALLGDGFLVVQTPDGENYTRNGALQLNANGILVNSEGWPILSNDGIIQFAPSETDISITQAGVISSSAGFKGEFKLVRFETPQTLTRTGTNLFYGANPLAAENISVQQGALEQSNINAVTELTEMIRITRSYQAVAGMMEKQDQLRRDAISSLGDLNA